MEPVASILQSSVVLVVRNEHVVPLLFTIVFWLLGKGFLHSSFVSDSMSRTGAASELALGPCHYGICISLATLFFWKRLESIFCIFPIAFGDGFAAFFGPHLKGNKPLGWNPSKTWFGLLAFVVITFVMLVVGCGLVMDRPWFLNEDPAFVPHSLFVAVMCALMESMSIANYDNFTIFGMGVLSYAFVHCCVCLCFQFQSVNSSSIPSNALRFSIIDNTETTKTVRRETHFQNKHTTPTSSPSSQSACSGSE